MAQQIPTSRFSRRRFLKTAAKAGAVLMAPQVIGAQLDAIPLDDQPLDDGIHLLTVTRTVVGP